MKTVSFSGHRPQNLIWGYNEKAPICKAFKKKLEELLIDLINQGYSHFICGMAMGFDMIAGEAVVKLKKKFDITLEAAIPCENQTQNWSKDYVKRYQKLLSKCDKQTLISKDYTPNCMMDRNKYMVDNCDLLVSLCKKNTKGGTKNTVDYAKKQNKDNINLNDF